MSVSQLPQGEAPPLIVPGQSPDQQQQESPVEAPLSKNAKKNKKKKEKKKLKAAAAAANSVANDQELENVDESEINGNQPGFTTIESSEPVAVQQPALIINEIVEDVQPDPVPEVLALKNIESAEVATEHNPAESQEQNFEQVNDIQSNVESIQDPVLAVENTYVEVAKETNDDPFGNISGELLDDSEVSDIDKDPVVNNEETDLFPIAEVKEESLPWEDTAQPAVPVVVEENEPLIGDAIEEKPCQQAETVDELFVNEPTANNDFFEKIENDNEAELFEKLDDTDNLFNSNENADLPWIENKESTVPQIQLQPQLDVTEDVLLQSTEGATEATELVFEEDLDQDAETTQGEQSDLFGNDDRSESLPWEEQPNPEAEKTADESDLFGNNSRSESLPWEREQQEHNTVIHQPQDPVVELAGEAVGNDDYIYTEKPAEVIKEKKENKFAFLSDDDFDDELLDDDLLDDDLLEEPVNPIPAQQLAQQPTLQPAQQPVQLVQPSRYEPVQPSRYEPIQPSRYEPVQQRPELKHSYSSRNSSNPYVSSTEAVPQHHLDLQKLNENKKKSDAYDFPIDLMPHERVAKPAVPYVHKPSVQVSGPQFPQPVTAAPPVVNKISPNSSRVPSIAARPPSRAQSTAIPQSPRVVKKQSSFFEELPIIQPVVPAKAARSGSIAPEVKQIHSVPNPQFNNPPLNRPVNAYEPKAPSVSGPPSQSRYPPATINGPPKPPMNKSNYSPIQHPPKAGNPLIPPSASIVPPQSNLYPPQPSTFAPAQSLVQAPIQNAYAVVRSPVQAPVQNAYAPIQAPAQNAYAPIQNSYALAQAPANGPPKQPSDIYAPVQQPPTTFGHVKQPSNSFVPVQPNIYGPPQAQGGSYLPGTTQTSLPQPALSPLLNKVQSSKFQPTVAPLNPPQSFTSAASNALKSPVQPSASKYAPINHKRQASVTANNYDPYSLSKVHHIPNSNYSPMAPITSKFESLPVIDQNHTIPHPQPINHRSHVQLSTLSQGLNIQQPISDPNQLLKRQFPLFSWSHDKKIAFYIPGNYQSQFGIRVIDTENILKEQSLKEFPVITKKNIPSILKYLDNKVLKLSERNSFSDDDEILLLKLLKHKLSKNTELFNYGAVFNYHDQSKPSTQVSHQPQQPLSKRHLFALISAGQKAEAVELALQYENYALALFISGVIDKSTWLKTVETYLANEFSGDENHFLPVLLHILVGNTKTVIESFRHDFHKKEFALNHWRELTSAVVSNNPESLNLFLSDYATFLFENGKVLAAYIVFFSGDLPLPPHLLSSSLKATLFSEIYGLILQESGKYVDLTEIYIQHAYLSIDYNLGSEAQRYLDLASAAIKTSKTGDNSLKYALNHLTEQITGSVDGGWFARPKLDKVWGQLDKSLNKFISGDEQPTKQKDGGVFSKFSPTVSRNSSFVSVVNAGNVAPSSVYDPNASFSARQPRRTSIPHPQSAYHVSHTVHASNANQHVAIPHKSQIDMHNTHHAPVAGHSSLGHPPNLSKAEFTLPQGSPNQSISPQPRTSKYIGQDHSYVPDALPPNQPVFASESTSNPLLSSPKHHNASSVLAPPSLNIPLKPIPLSNVPPPTIAAKKPKARVPRYAPSTFEPVKDTLDTKPIQREELHAPQPVKPVDQQQLQAPLVPSHQPEEVKHKDAEDFEKPIEESSVIENGALEEREPAREEFEYSANGTPGVSSTVQSVSDFGSSDVVPYDSNVEVNESNNHHNGQEFDIPEVLRQEVYKSVSTTIDDETVENSPNTPMLSNAYASVEQTDTNTDTYTPIEQVVPKANIYPPVGPVVPEPVITKSNDYDLPEPAASNTNASTAEHEISQSNSYPAVSNVENGTSKPHQDISEYKYPSAASTPNIHRPAPLDFERTSTQPSLAVGRRTSTVINPYAPVGTPGQSRKPSASYPPQPRKSSYVPIPIEESKFNSYRSQSIGDSDTVTSSFNPSEGPTISTPQTSKFEPLRPASVDSTAIEGSPSTRFKAYEPPTTNHNITNIGEEDEEYYDDIIEEEEEDEEDEVPEPKKVTPVKKVEEKPAKKEKSEEGEGSGWFNWLRKDNNGPKVYKAHLGESNSFYYDEKLKRWVNKNASPEELESISAPTPPPPVIKKKPSNLSKPRSDSVTDGLLPPSGAPSPVTSVRGPGAGPGPSPLGTRKASATPAASDLDSLIGLSGPNANAASARRKKRGGRGYVDVMGSMQEQK